MEGGKKPRESTEYSILFRIRVFLSANREIAFVLCVCTFGRDVKVSVCVCDCVKKRRRRHLTISILLFHSFFLCATNNKNSAVFNFISFLFLFFFHLLFYFYFSIFVPYRSMLVQSQSLHEVLKKCIGMTAADQNANIRIHWINTELNDMHTQISVLRESSSKGAPECGNIYIIYTWGK